MPGGVRDRLVCGAMWCALIGSQQCVNRGVSRDAAVGIRWVDGNT